MGKYYFYLEKTYRDSQELFDTLFDKGLKSTNGLFLWCCDCIMYYAKVLGISYEEMNLIVFVFIQPTIILFLFFLYIREKMKIKLIQRGLSRL